MIFHWIGNLTIFKMAPSAVLYFRNLQFVTWPFFRHAILLRLVKFRWNRIIGWWPKTRFSTWPSSVTYRLDVFTYVGLTGAVLSAGVRTCTTSASTHSETRRRSRLRCRLLLLSDQLDHTSTRDWRVTTAVWPRVTWGLSVIGCKCAWPHSSHYLSMKYRRSIDRYSLKTEYYNSSPSVIEELCC